MQKFSRMVFIITVVLPHILIVLGFFSSPAYALKEAGVKLVLGLLLFACTPWAIFHYYNHRTQPQERREVDFYYLSHLYFFVFINAFAYQGSKVIIIASSHWWPSTIVTATVFSKGIEKKYGGRGQPDYFIHTIQVSVPGDSSMRLQVTPPFYNHVKTGQHLKINLRETPFAYVYSGFYQAESTIIYE